MVLSRPVSRGGEISGTEKMEIGNLTGTGANPLVSGEYGLPWQAGGDQVEGSVEERVRETIAGTDQVELSARALESEPATSERPATLEASLDPRLDPTQPGSTIEFYA